MLGFCTYRAKYFSSNKMSHMYIKLVKKTLCVPVFLLNMKNEATLHQNFFIKYLYLYIIFIW